MPDIVNVLWDVLLVIGVLLVVVHYMNERNEKARGFGPQRGLSQ